eukprot:5940292-Ditylum_brightwellii.AAC.1
MENCQNQGATQVVVQSKAIGPHGHPWKLKVGKVQDQFIVFQDCYMNTLLGLGDSKCCGDLLQE